jgi:hypothetical protein
MDNAEEFYCLQNYFGTDWINKLLGNFKSYKAIRENFSFQDVFNEIKLLEHG